MAETPKTFIRPMLTPGGIKPFGSIPTLRPPGKPLVSPISPDKPTTSVVGPPSVVLKPTPIKPQQSSLFDEVPPARPKPLAPTPSPVEPKPAQSAIMAYGPKKSAIPVLAAQKARFSLTERHKKTESPGKQIIYKPGSKFAPTGAMVPSDVASSMQNALMEFQDNYGDIDAFVARGLGVTEEKLNQIMSAEQIDAVALGVAAAMENRGFIVGDMTGFGKGRIIVAISVIIMRTLKRPTIFSTEKATLFSDLFRDIRDTGTELEIGEPLLLNVGSKIVDMSNRTGATLFKHSASKMAQVVQSGKIPKGTNLLMTTYSQFSRGGDKQKFLLSAAEDAHLINDEAQNLVGDSAVGEFYSKALRSAKSSTFSSATFARHITNLSAYSQVMPWLESFFVFSGLNPDKLAPNFRRSLAEASLLRAISDGGLIRREHDMSSMKLNMEDVGWENDAHEEIADKLAVILQQMMSVSKIVNGMVESRNNELSATERADRALWTYANFGSRMSMIGSQWEVAMMVKGAVDFTVKVLLKGQKPALVLDSTMEAMMKEVLDIEEGQAPGDQLGGTPSFRDSLSIVAKNLLKVKYKSGAGEKGEANWIETHDLIYKVNKILNDIATFPDLPLSPLDAMRHGIEDAGKALFDAGKIPHPWVVGEISGRSLGINKAGQIEDYDPGDRNLVVSKYVNGGIDVIILTRAGAVGLSAHDSAAFADHKQRHMIEIRAPSNVLERVQMWGRVWRRGQLTEPEFTALTLPLPTVIYGIASQNKKIAEMSASVSGNSKSLRMAKDIEDPIDVHGDMAASVMLSRDQELRALLWMGDGSSDDAGSEDIEKSDGGEDFPTVSKMLRRMRLLPVHRQRQVFEDFWIIREDMHRTFPDEPSVLDGIWEIKSERVLEPVPRPGRPPVKEVKIFGERNVQPITEERLNNMLALGEDRYKDITPLIKQERLAFLDRVKTRDMPECPNLATALAAPVDNEVLKADKNISKLIDILRVAKTGVTITMPPGETGRPAIGIITEVHCKNSEEPCLPQNHIIQIASPGEDKLRRISVDTIISKPDMYKITLDPEIYRQAVQGFRSAIPGIIEVSRTMIMGESVEEAFASVRLGGGSRVSFRTLNQDGTELWHTGILVPKNLEREVNKLSVVVTKPKVAIEILRRTMDNGKGYFLTSSGIPSRNIFQFGPVFSRDLRETKTWMVAMSTTSHSIASYLEVALKDKVPSFKMKREKDITNMMIKTTDAQLALEILMRMGIRLHADHIHRNLILDAEETPQASSSPSALPAQPQSMRS
jgi:hypothetical protein